MYKPIQDMTSWGASGEVPLDGRMLPPTTQPGSSMGRSSMPPPSSDDWAAAPNDIGRRVGASMWDMSVVCEAAEALSLQFDVMQPLFLAVHDIGGTTSRRLLAGVAAAMQIPVHTLSIRRQGFGNLLARIEFVELSTSDASTRSQPVRIYSTQTPDSDEVSRRHVAEVLLGRAALSVMIVGSDANQAALAMSLAAMQNAMDRPVWSNRHMLLMPMRPMAGLHAQAAQLSRDREVAVEVSQPIVRPFDAWNYVRSAWNTLADLGLSAMMPLDDPTSPRNRPGARPSAEQTAAAVEQLRRRLLNERDRAPTHPPSPADAHIDAAAKTIASLPKREPKRPQTAVASARRETPTPFPTPSPAPVDDAPTVPANFATPVEGELRRVDVGPKHSVFDDLLLQCSTVAGMQCCAVVDLSTRHTVAEFAVADGQAFAGHGTRLANSLRAAALGLHLPGRIPDAAMTFDDHHVLVRPVPGHGHLAFIAILGREEANVVVARLKLHRIEKALFPDVVVKAQG